MIMIGRIIDIFRQKNEIVDIDDNFFEEDIVTDEIEKSLICIRDSLNIPEEEIRLSIESRRILRRKSLDN